MQHVHQVVQNRKQLRIRWAQLGDQNLVTFIELSKPDLQGTLLDLSVYILKEDITNNEGYGRGSYISFLGT